MSFLRQCAIQIDFDAGKVKFYKAAPPHAAELGDPRRLEFTADGRPTIEALVCGLVREPFVLDSGASVISLETALFDRLLEDGRIEQGTPFVSMAVSGETTGKSGRLASFQVGSFKHEAIPCDRDHTCAIGLRYLSRYVVTCDFPHRLLYLKSGRRYATASKRATSGLVLTREEGQTLVRGVKQGSPAMRAGVRKNDQMLSIGGRSVDELDLFAVGQLLMDEVGKRVVLSMRRGTRDFEASFELADRFAAASARRTER